jgi:hypothetical protein
VGGGGRRCRRAGSRPLYRVGLLERGEGLASLQGRALGEGGGLAICIPLEGRVEFL